MSTQKGNGARTRPQKYRNRTAFRNDMYDKTPQQKHLNALHISEVCLHCKSVIEWKIKYKKYKSLTKPKTCTRCHERNIVKAYYVLCRGCALKDRVCAKCLKSAAEVDIEPSKPTPVEEQKLKAEMERLINSFPERKRRAFLRFMKKGKQQDRPALEEQEAASSSEDDTKRKDDDDNEKNETKCVFIPHTRDELLQKIEELALADAAADESDISSDDEDDRL